jgi:hypothetical protein
MIAVTIRAKFLPAERPSPAPSSTYTRKALPATVSEVTDNTSCYDPGAEKVPDQEVKKKVAETRETWGVMVTPRNFAL